MADAFVTISEIANLFGVKPRTVRKWVDRGELSAVRVGRRHIRIGASEIEAVLAPGSTAAAAEAPNAKERVRVHERGLDLKQARTRLAQGKDARLPIARVFLHPNGSWRWTMFAAGPLLWLLAVLASAGLGTLIH
jgi:excisionase family DNA binding protein